MAGRKKDTRGKVSAMASDGGGHAPAMTDAWGTEDVCMCVDTLEGSAAVLPEIRPPYRAPDLHLVPKVGETSPAEHPMNPTNNKCCESYFYYGFPHSPIFHISRNFFALTLR